MPASTFVWECFTSRTTPCSANRRRSNTSSRACWGHWGSDPGQAFTYIHFNRLINKYGLDAIYLSGPGHGAPSVLSQAYLEGTYCEIYPDKTEDVAGMQRFFRQFSFPGGIGSHATPKQGQLPGSSGRTSRSPTGSMQRTRSPRRRGWPSTSPRTPTAATWLRMGGRKERGEFSYSDNTIPTGGFCNYLILC